MNKIKSQIETLLFVSGKALSSRKISELTGFDKKEIEKNIEDLMKRYEEENRGIVIVKNLSKYQMLSSEKNSALVEKFLKKEISGDLSQPALETLSIIAYRGPITKAELEQIRGVNCSLILRNLMIRGLIESKKGKELKDFSSQEKKFLNMEEYYYITFNFLKFLGIKSVEDLPNYDKLNKEIEEKEGLKS